MKTLTANDFDDWRSKARRLLALGIPPQEVQFLDAGEQPSLFGDDEDDLSASVPAQRSLSVSREFISLSINVAYHRDTDRWNLLYRTLWRITQDTPALLEIATDDDVLRLNRMQKQVTRDAHKMKAFVRFRKTVQQHADHPEGVEHFIAWHRPDHRIVRKVAPFFSRRFNGMHWTIMTPYESVVWNQKKLVYGPGVPRSEAPKSDELESLWKTYYGSIFNPARVKVKMMKSEMPVRYWDTMPEAELISDLLRDAPRRVEQMIEQHEGFDQTAASFITAPDSPAKPALTMPELKSMAATCTACDLHQHATQTVFGVGPVTAKLVLLGEQPGDQEDLRGQPFVGPAGKVLSDALIAAGIDREALYLTNIVKHFKFKVTETTSISGKHRLHQKPNAREVRCCRPWFEAEWNLLQNAEVLVCLGATAAKSIINPGFRITQSRGQFVPSDHCPQTLATWHPSAILRTPDREMRAVKMQQLIDDLIVARELIASA